MECRPGCGACCIAPSITSPLPALPQGKGAGVPCPHLDDNRLCRLFATAARPAVCSSYRASVEYCGNSHEEAMAHLAELERLTA